jgi:hypothetical protein
MKIIRIEREISQHIATSKYESITPSLRLVAEITDGEDYAVAIKELEAAAVVEWNKAVLNELRMVAKRREGAAVIEDKLPGLMTYQKTELLNRG